MKTPESSVPTSFESKFNQWLTETKTNFSQFRKDTQIRIGMLQEQLKEKPSIKPIERWFRRLLVTLIVGGHLAACVPETQFVAPDNVNRVVATSTDFPPEAPETATSTTVVEEATATQEQPAPTPTYVVEASGGAYTPAQEALNKSPEALAQQERFQRWLDYWGSHPTNRPFEPKTILIHWHPVYDNPQNPTEVVMLIEVGGPDYQNKLFGVPMNEEGFVDFPPPVTDTSIQPGLGPLEINPNKDNTVLSADQGTLVRKEFNFKGDIVERLVAGHWEAVEQYPIDINKIHNFPESYEYMVNNLNEFVEAPDGFSDPEALYNWWTEKCIPALGNQEDLEPNVFGVPDVSTAGFGFHTMIYESKSLLSEPNIFYFRYNNKIYPVLVLTVEDEFNINVGTFAFIIHNKSQNGDDGFDALKTLSTGEKIASLFGQTDDILGGDQSLEIQKFLHSDFNWKDFNGYTWSNLEPGMLWKDRPNKYAIGLGAIRTYDD